MSLGRRIDRQDFPKGERGATGRGRSPSLARSLPFESEERAGGVCVQRTAGGSGLAAGNGFRVGRASGERVRVRVLV